MTVDPPLRGEWVATSTPAERIPSHGTDYLGQRFAFDFVRFRASLDLPYERGLLRHLFVWLPAESFLCWNEPVHASFDGVVAEVGDHWPDRMRVSLPIGHLASIISSPQPNGTDIRPLAGNFVIVEGEGFSALYAHLRRESITVRAGDVVRSGDLLGRVGNSGNSTMPHLHFHLMNRPEVFEAEGLPCRFRGYERLAGDRWEAVEDGVPGLLERLRFSDPLRGSTTPRGREPR